MAELDGESNLVGAIRTSAVAAGSAAAPTEPGQAIPLPFPEDFVLRSAIRDKIRQRILENQLDDRHDLTGNSIYGLKFETAVVPGSNTYAKPYVIVRLNADTLPSEYGPVEFLASQQSAQEPERGSPFDVSWTQYNGWRRNLEGRLNGYLKLASQRDGSCVPVEGRPEPDPLAAVDSEKILPQDSDPPAFSAVTRSGEPSTEPVSARAGAAASATGDGWSGLDRDRLSKALRQVMAIERRELHFAPWQLGGRFGTINIPAPWSSFFQLQVWRSPDETIGGDQCPGEVFFQLKPVYVMLYWVEETTWIAWERGATDEEKWQVLALKVAEADGVRGRVVVRQTVSPTGAGTSRQPDPTAMRLLSDLRAAELSSALGRSNDSLSKLCIVQKAALGSGTPECTLSARPVAINASLFEFIRMIEQATPYAYAVFPRGDVEGVLSDRSLRAGISAGQEAGSFALTALQRTREAGAEPVVVNFGGGRSTGRALGEFDFGWAIVKEGRQQPAQVSQLVLVSVPAYLDALELWVETGWLDRHANPIGPPPDPALVDTPRVMQAGERQLTRMRVALPPDYEAIDTLVTGATRLQGPVVNQLALPASFTVRACANADILIPGDRLWRSTTVSIGGQLADRVTVLPDMRGIVASFEPVRLPMGDLSRPDAIDETLTVWTSEGSDRLPRNVRIVVPAELTSARECPRLAADDD